ncbi:MAG: FKBP-type peptidyl-prolyl cis-trans isomerase, partial [Polyangiales bacterium]
MRGAVAVFACIVAIASCRDRDDRSKITAPNDPTKPIVEPLPETPMTLSSTPGVASIEAPRTVSGPPPDAFVSSTGLATKRLIVGSGTRHPGPTDNVKVHYTGWKTDGKMFDSSITRGEPATFPLKGVIKGWTEGVQLMHVGDTMRFWIPADLAYGDKPKRPGAPAGMLVFDIELISIKYGIAG